MSSITVLLIFAAGIMISVWSEPIRVELERRDEAGQAIVQCLAEGFVKVAEDMKMMKRATGTSDSEEQMIKEACSFFKNTEECVLNKVREYPPPQRAPEIIYLSAAYEYQHLFIAHQADMCKDILYDDLKRVADESGALAKLEKVEDKKYHPCVRRVLRDCLSEMVKSFEQQNNLVNPHFEYVECYQRESDSIPCKAPMLGAFLHNSMIIKQEWNTVKGGNY